MPTPKNVRLRRSFSRFRPHFWTFQHILSHRPKNDQKQGGFLLRGGCPKYHWLRVDRSSRVQNCQIQNSKFLESFEMHKSCNRAQKSSPKLYSVLKNRISSTDWLANIWGDYILPWAAQTEILQAWVSGQSVLNFQSFQIVEFWCFFILKEFWGTWDRNLKFE